MMIESNNNPRGIDIAGLLKESAIAALVALGLTIVMLGLRTVDTTTGLGITTRWPLVAVAVISVFAGRLLFAFRREWKASKGPVSRDRKKEEDRAATIIKRFSTIGGPVFIAFALVLPLMPFADRYVVDVATYVLIYVMLGWGLNIVVGLAGLLDLGYVAFYAVGAYSYALFAFYFDLSFWVCLPLAGLCAASFGVLLGFPVLRLRGDYLAIVTLGFGEIIRIILLNWYKFTNGPDGISGIPRPSFFGLEFKRTAVEGTQTFHQFFDLDYSSMHRLIFLYYLILILALITNFFTLRIRKMPVGRAWEALREDEIACRSLGINPTNTKLTAFALGAMFAGFAGSFFATRQAFISPESFTFIESAVILAIVVLGGMGSQVGVAIAAILLIGGTELFRGLEEYRMLAFGGLMVAIMVWKPRGLLAHREPTIKLHPDKGPPPEAIKAVTEGEGK
ncbi:high-affinity branched-chain amino acid ABC transporter permease LivM [Sedimenticola sp.]|uniref:high-affinity branched-chain amino acid ABC transporter permease LivM n=1 Tax=Sedimenticola sp. TaxID=1940285 RepID=UPI00258DAEF5|nr:high-affinity branched-chain amino acid ABC transporter permease LivM [Sedimenticola sp.]MCW8903488.1 high-affinity branched-chain amino acid ABC transporter permease LivM [Sedimenticola sp.]